MADTRLLLHQEVLLLLVADGEGAPLAGPDAAPLLARRALLPRCLRASSACSAFRVGGPEGRQVAEVRGPRGESQDETPRLQTTPCLQR